ncbi:ABC transporter permease subunit [Sanguibacter sp. HDW7]|uniref:ABC transporter permease subunit n=1 Tax=Sanguibacter sp. HDW7 TaxID=2714931 RepID=UPI00140C6FC7|nr:ABC transporter permease subunit [Sanguibacter sp. HDW7]QIK82892.1 ABC transporter permease subunit [Sanguibacter sp. HDW7]
MSSSPLTADATHPDSRERRPRRESPARTFNSTDGYVVKLVLMALVNALGLFIAWSAWTAGSWFLLGGSLVLLAAADWVYFSRRTVPLKYILPGLLFLLVFQIFTMAYTGYVAFTNYGSGHTLTKERAIDALLIQNERRDPEAPSYPLSILRDAEGTLGFAIVDDGSVRVGDAETPLAAAPDATLEGKRITAVPGWDVLALTDLVGDPALLEKVSELRVPVSEDDAAGSIRTQDGSRGAIYRSVLVYDDAADTMTDVETGVVYRPNDRGSFVAEDGTALGVGWRVVVGFENFTKAFTDSAYAGPFAKILVWTFAFAILTVLSSFLVGLLIAGVFNDPRIRGQKVWRTLFILPYAFPAFLSALLWKGMLHSNPDYGIINQLFFFGQRIEWLDDPTLAKLAILGVNLWLSYPYWFLVCTGALQSLPADVVEAATIDGAGPVRIWRAITLPLLLVSTAPLIISSFAFNFNNFTLIYMLTNGRPRFTDTSAPLGHTDILISMVYQISGVAGGRADYGLASALSLLIFVIVGVISVLAFRQTRKLEEML